MRGREQLLGAWCRSGESAQLRKERIRGYRPPEKFRQQLPCRVLFAAAEQMARKPLKPAWVTRLEGSELLCDALAKVCGDHTSQTIIHHVARQVHQLHPHGPPRIFGMRSHVQVALCNVGPELIGI